MSKLRIGFTNTPDDRSYVPTLDGWRAGVEDTSWIIQVPSEIDSGDLEEMAEAFFEASNMPMRDFHTNEIVYSSDERVRFFQELLVNERANTRRTLNVGDTVSYVSHRADGSEAVHGLVECLSAGWKTHI